METKKLTQDLMSKYSTLNGAKYFSKNRLQNYQVFFTFGSQLATLNGKKNLGDPKGCQTRVLKIRVRQIILLQQRLIETV